MADYYCISDCIMLNICWIPVIDFITDGKYGNVNSETIFLLSLSMPLLYFTNYLWTIHFAKGNLKLIFSIMALSFTVNIIACSILIPIFKNEGAAIAYLITVVAQLILYIGKKQCMSLKTKGITCFYGHLLPPVPASLHFCISPILLAGFP